jgi:hypothetical protein
MIERRANILLDEGVSRDGSNVSTKLMSYSFYTYGPNWIMKSIAGIGSWILAITSDTALTQLK